MPNKNKRNVGKTVMFSEKELQKVELLAEHNHMTISEYLRYSALGTRMKPTIIQVPEKEDDQLQKLQSEVDQFKKANKELQQRNRDLYSLLVNLRNKLKI